MKGLRGGGKTQSLIIQVAGKGGYSFTFNSALFSLDCITAKRVLRSIKGITKFPKDVIGQLVASWLPPELVELHVNIETKIRELRLVCLQWRLHVTHSGDSHKVNSIRTPYSRSLRLKRAKGPKRVIRVQARD